MGIAEADLKVGDRVVYPNQGVCQVIGTTEMEIGGHREVFIKLSREDDGASVMVPKGRIAKVGLRRVANEGEIQQVFSYLAAPVEGPELDWKVRHRTHGEKMSEGGLMGLAQVVKGLTTLADLRPLPPKERELYDNARHLLISEIAAASGLPDVSAEDAVDLALFPPGKERKKPELALPLGGEDLGLDGELDMGEMGIEMGETSEEETAEGSEEEGPEAEGEEEEGEEAKKAAEAPKRGRPRKAAKTEEAQGAGEKPRKPRAKAAPKAEKAKKEPKAPKKPAKEKPPKESKPKASKAKAKK